MGLGGTWADILGREKQFFKTRWCVGGRALAVKAENGESRKMDDSVSFYEMRGREGGWVGGGGGVLLLWCVYELYDPTRDGQAPSGQACGQSHSLKRHCFRRRTHLFLPCCSFLPLLFPDGGSPWEAEGGGATPSSHSPGSLIAAYLPPCHNGAVMISRMKRLS